MAALLGLLAGCESAPPKASPTLNLVAGYSQQGKQSFQDGDYGNALASFNKALQLDRSIENADGIALNLLNIAQIHLATQRTDLAHVCLDEVLNNTLGLFHASQLALAAVQKSLIHLRQGQPDAAGEWIGKAGIFCGDSCQARGLIMNIQARLALDNKQPDQAIDLANRALSIHQKAMAVPEMANSLRLIGEGHLAKQATGKAILFFQDALQLDKSQGLSAKIGIDLLLLGMAHADRPDQSAVFFKRAIAVSLAANDPDGARRANNALESISCKADGKATPCD